MKNLFYILIILMTTSLLAGEYLASIEVPKGKYIIRGKLKASAGILSFISIYPKTTREFSMQVTNLPLIKKLMLKNKLVEFSGEVIQVNKDRVIKYKKGQKIRFITLKDALEKPFSR